MDNYAKVEGSRTLYKNMNTGFVNNFDEEGLARAKARKKARKEQEEKVQKLENEVSELKDMVRSLIKDR